MARMPSNDPHRRCRSEDCIPIIVAKHQNRGLATRPCGIALREQQPTDVDDEQDSHSCNRMSNDVQRGTRVLRWVFKGRCRRRRCGSLRTPPCRSRRNCGLRRRPPYGGQEEAGERATGTATAACPRIAGKLLKAIRIAHFVRRNRETFQVLRHSRTTAQLGDQGCP